jgi:hypothetical protein
MIKRHPGGVAQRWGQLSERQRRAIVVAAVFESALKLAMVLDLQRRPAAEVRGAKWLWRCTALINSAGIAPLAYFLLGRRPPDDQPGG